MRSVSRDLKHSIRPSIAAIIVLELSLNLYLEELSIVFDLSAPSTRRDLRRFTFTSSHATLPARFLSTSQPPHLYNTTLRLSTSSAQANSLLSRSALPRSPRLEATRCLKTSVAYLVSLRAQSLLYDLNSASATIFIALPTLFVSCRFFIQ